MSVSSPLDFDEIEKDSIRWQAGATVDSAGMVARWVLPLRSALRASEERVAELTLERDEAHALLRDIRAFSENDIRTPSPEVAAILTRIEAVVPKESKR